MATSGAGGGEVGAAGSGPAATDGDETGGAGPDAPAAGRWFAGALVGAFVVGLGVRLAYTARSTVPSQPGFLVTFDPIYYHRQARAVADGLGFIAPYRADGAPSADHPPLLVIVLAVASKLGITGFAAHRGITALIGAAVVPVVGLLGRRIDGPRTGVVAAVLAAVAPTLWINDGQLMPEPLFALLVATALLVAHHLWERARWPLAVVLGALVALAALTRGEGLLLSVFLVGPVVLWAPGLDGWRARLRVVVLSGVACVLVLAPWLAHNASRFEEQVLLSTSADTTLAGASCDLTFSGEGLGSWTPECFSGHSNQRLEESVFGGRIRADAVEYVRDNAGDLPRVVAARVGRVWEVFRPGDGVTLNELQNRPRPVSWAALATFYALVPLSVLGAVGLRRRGRPIVLLVAMPVMVTVVVAASYGNARFRVPADLAMVVLAAAALRRWWPDRWWPAPGGSVASEGGREAPDQDAQRPRARALGERG